MREFPLVPPRTPEDERFFQRYGPWAAVRPTEVGELLDGFVGDWWVAGGWAIDAFTSSTRPHDDIDIGVFRKDIRALRTAVDGRLDVWAIGPGGSLWPVDDVLPEDSTQVWLRADASSPWLIDLLLTPDDNDRWVNRRDGSSAPLATVTWLRGEIRYLATEYILMYKAAAARDKDRADLERAWPHMDAEARIRLRRFVDVNHPGHPWPSLMTLG